MIQGSISSWGKRTFSVLQNVHTSSGAHPASYSTCTKETKGYKLAEWHRETDTLPSMNDKCKQNNRDKIQKRKWLKQRYFHSSVCIKCSDNWIFCLRTGLLMHGIKVKVQLSLCTRWHRMSGQHPVHQRVGGPHSQSGHFWKWKKSPVPAKNGTPNHPASNLVTTLTTPSTLQTCS